MAAPIAKGDTAHARQLFASCRPLIRAVDRMAAPIAKGDTAHARRLFASIRTQIRAVIRFANDNKGLLNLFLDVFIVRQFIRNGQKEF